MKKHQGKELSMNKVREILRLSLEKGLSQRDISRSVVVGQSSVNRYLSKVKDLGLTWSESEVLNDEELAILLGLQVLRQRISSHAAPDYKWVHQELKKKGVTLQLLWEEYQIEHPQGYQRTQFCELYRRWKTKLHPVMRQDHRGGEKVFVDYCGPTVSVRNPKNGSLRNAQIFVGVLGASNYTFAEATWTQGLPDWINSHVHMFEYFGGVPEAVIPDNLKSGVTKACFYEPDINPTYRDLARHYHVVVLPTRVRKPKDKAKVEAGVLLVERWIIAVFRNREFFSLEELNQEIWRLLKRLNERPFKKLPGTRKSAFEELDRPQLSPLPKERFTFSQWKNAKVNIDYHVELNRHYYSVPFKYVKEKIQIRYTDKTVEIFHHSIRIASHLRSNLPGRHTTLKEHMPTSHQRQMDWSPSRLIQWASSIGPQTSQLVKTILQSRKFPEQGYRSCLGIMRLNKTYSATRLEGACRRANLIGSASFGSIQSILKNGLDTFEVDLPQSLDIDHENVRGSQYYELNEKGNLPC